MKKTLNISNYTYFPILRTRLAEMKGYGHLDDDCKDKTMPILTLGKWGRLDNIDKSIEKIENEYTHDRFYILDVTKENKHQTEGALALTSPENNFEPWLKLIQSKTNIVPIVQFDSRATNRQIVRQAIKIEQMGKNPIFRIRSSQLQQDLDTTLDCLYPLDDPSRALVIIDAGFLRDISTKRIRVGTLESILASLNVILDEIDNVPIVLAGTSYPRSVTQFVDEGSEETKGKIDMLEHTLYEEIGSEIILYGDHASIHSVVYDDEGGTFLPRLDVPYDHFWHFERRPNQRNSEGYKDAAQALIERFPHLKVDTSWGAKMLCNTAIGENEKINAPVTAIMVRVNLHLNYQLNFLSAFKNQGATEEKENDLF